MKKEPEHGPTSLSIRGATAAIQSTNVGLASRAGSMWRAPTMMAVFGKSSSLNTATDCSCIVMSESTGPTRVETTLIT
jgi:hypothetical protein